MAAPINRFEKHARTALILLWGLTLIAGVALLEWALSPGGGRYRATGLNPGPGPARHLVLREWRRNTDYQFLPTEARKRYAQGGLPKTYRIATDAEGFIEPARRHAKPDVSIVFLGGSTTECAFVLPENRFPHLAARKLEEALGLKVNGINAGLSGNNSMHALTLLLGKVIPLQPDFVVLMEAANDVGTLSAHGSYWVKEGSLRMVEGEKQSVGEAGRVFVRALIPYTSEFLQEAAKSVRRIFRSRPAHAAEAKGNAAGALERQKAMARDYESSLKSFVRLASAWGITPVLVTQVNVQPRSEAERRDIFINRERLAGVVQRPEEFANVHEHFNAIVREVAKAEGALLIDLAAARTWAFGDVYDAVHFTDSGSQHVADIIAAALKDRVAAGAKR
jgi:lysophospholipase L1-like esterase